MRCLGVILTVCQFVLAQKRAYLIEYRGRLTEPLKQFQIVGPLVGHSRQSSALPTIATLRLRQVRFKRDGRCCRAVL